MGAEYSSMKSLICTGKCPHSLPAALPDGVCRHRLALASHHHVAWPCSARPRGESNGLTFMSKEFRFLALTR